ncbi:hypothetical protein HO173_008790 [Letharia columbiana]|uniref:BTB domain-containing protein n=1 Tax=Letharia columbiana TaxID=112416 RepID=A0A8H6L2G4_9LECA|nr:uncharacterized protein HO173_008790 [Letharia columbiana]KAF6233034.1 hypothetical protein HO173_008790 [Letharia columbiana]
MKVSSDTTLPNSHHTLPRPASDDGLSFRKRQFRSEMSLRSRSSSKTSTFLRRREGTGPFERASASASPPVGLRNPTSVLVTVGNTKAATTWSIPKNLLTHHSAFFNTIVQDNKVALPEDDPDTFELLVQWLYAGGLNTVATRSEPYVKAWILGDKLKCLTFRDHAMLQILHCHKRGDFPERPISPESVRLAYGQTQPESKLHLWALDQFKFNSVRGTMSGRSEEWVPVLEEMHDLEKETARALMRSGERGIQNPYTQGQKYLEVLKHADFRDPV